MCASERKLPPNSGQSGGGSGSEGAGRAATQPAVGAWTPLQPGASESPGALPPLAEGDRNGTGTTASPHCLRTASPQAGPGGGSARHGLATAHIPPTGHTPASHPSTGSDHRRKTGQDEAGAPLTDRTSVTARNTPTSAPRRSLHRHDSEGSVFSQYGDAGSVFVLSHAQGRQGAAAGEGSSPLAKAQQSPQRRLSSSSTLLSDVAEVPQAVHLPDGSRIEYRVAMPARDGRGTVLAHPSEVEMRRVPLSHSSDSEGSQAASLHAGGDPTARDSVAPLRCYSPSGSMRLPTSSGFVQAPLFSLSPAHNRPHAPSLHAASAASAVGTPPLALPEWINSARSGDSPVGSARGAPVVQSAPPLVEAGFLGADSSLAQWAALQGAVSQGTTPPTSSPQVRRGGGMHRGNGFGASPHASSSPQQGGGSGLGSDQLARKLPPKEVMFTRPAFGPGSEDELIRERYEARRDSFKNRVVKQGSRALNAVPSPRRRWSVVRSSLLPRLQHQGAAGAGAGAASAEDGGSGQGGGDSGGKPGVRQAQEAVLSLRANVMRRRLANGIRRASFSSGGGDQSVEDPDGEEAAAASSVESPPAGDGAVAATDGATAAAAAVTADRSKQHVHPSQRPHGGYGDSSSDSDDDSGVAAGGASIDVGHSLESRTSEPLR